MGTIVNKIELTRPQLRGTTRNNYNKQETTIIRPYFGNPKVVFHYLCLFVTCTKLHHGMCICVPVVICTSQEELMLILAKSKIICKCMADIEKEGQNLTPIFPSTYNI